jgi:ubiquinone/menaquinone biosynthesis C-methylase UbiE
MAEHQPRYTHGHHEAVLRSHRWRTVANSAAYVIPHLAPGIQLLDVGCGPGTITLDFAGRVAPGRVLGIDASESVIELARAEQAERRIGNVEFRTADVYALDLDDNTFDVVHAHQVLQHLADPVAALREMRRVCKPGGVVSARDGDYTAMTWYPADPALDRWIEIYNTVARANDGEPDAGRYLLAWAHAAGFTDVKSTATAWCYATPDDREWWGELWADRMTKTAVGDQAVELGATTRDELDAIADAWRRWKVHPDGWFAVLSGEILARA